MRCIKLSKVGDIYTTKEGYEIEVLENINNRKLKIKFLDEHGYITFINVGNKSTKNQTIIIVFWTNLVLFFCLYP